MRLIGNIASEEKVIGFSYFLTLEGIENQYEVSYGTEFHPSYNLWILREEDYLSASKYYEEFLARPEDLKFSPEKKPTIQQSIPKPQKKNSFFLLSSLTHWILLVCAVLFIWDSKEEEMIRKDQGSLALDLGFSPIEQSLLFDYPKSIEQLESLIKQYPVTSLEKLKSEPPAVQEKYRDALDGPAWKGFVALLLKKIHTGTFGESVPLFEKIRQGEVWRLFSPTLLHRDFWHIFFNMGWLLILGKQIEVRLKRSRMLLLVIALGVFSNTVQYLMSGPYFLGFSGVVAGFAAFIWSRQKKAPWEGYPFHKTTAFFLFYLILLMFLVGVVCFFLQAFSLTDFSSNIANTAHISGGLLGFVLGRCNFFSRRCS